MPDTSQQTCILMHINTPELFEIIMSNLPPRHVYKLMQTNKDIMNVVKNNKKYWARVTLHLVWNDFICIDPWYPETADAITEKNKLIARNGGVDITTLKYLVNLPHGYKTAMDCFEKFISSEMELGDVDAVGEYNGEDMWGWRPFCNACINTKIVLGIERKQKQAQRFIKFLSPMEQTEYIVLDAVKSMSNNMQQAKTLTMYQKTKREPLKQTILKMIRGIDDMNLDIMIKRELADLLINIFEYSREDLVFHCGYDRNNLPLFEKMNLIKKFMRDRLKLKNFIQDNMFATLTPKEDFHAIYNAIFSPLFATKLINLYTFIDNQPIQHIDKARLAQLIVHGFTCTHPLHRDFPNIYIVPEAMYSDWCEIAGAYIGISQILVALKL